MIAITVRVGDAISGQDRSLAWLGDSEMARRVAEHDWCSMPLGAISGWPLSLKCAAAICLGSRFPMAIFWGPELTCIHNDAAGDVLEKLNPDALGLPARELLGESWEVVGPHFRAVTRRGDAIWAVDRPLTFDRRGSLAVGFFTYSCSPILDDQGEIGGVLLVAEDTTARALAQRRLDGIRELATRPLDEATDGEERWLASRSESATTFAWAEEHGRPEHELRTLLDELRAAQRRVVIAADAERHRIERDLHDGAQQHLMAIRLELGLVDEIVETAPLVARTKLDSIRRHLDEALEEMRELAHGLHPPLLASDGLYAALSAATRHAALPVNILGSDIGRAPPPVETAAYFCCLEALQNAAKHAGPDARATIRLALNDGVLSFSVRDDGVGFDPEAAGQGHGLVNLCDRLATLGGHAEIVSALGEGTTVLGQIPIS